MLHLLASTVSIVLSLLLWFVCCDWDSAQQPCRITWTSLGWPKLSVMCASSRLVVIFVRIMTRMTCAQPVRREGRKTFTREDNCMACSSWDNLTWDAYEANLAKKEKICERKRQRAAKRSVSVSSENSVNMFPDSAEEDGFEEDWRNVVSSQW